MNNEYEDYFGNDFRESYIFKDSNESQIDFQEYCYAMTLEEDLCKNISKSFSMMSSIS